MMACRSKEQFQGSAAGAWTGDHRECQLPGRRHSTALDRGCRL